MLKMKAKKQQYTLNNQSESGFTLIEMLVSLSMTIIILSITPPLWSYLTVEPQSDQFSVSQFFYTLTDEVQLNQFISYSDESISLQNSDGDQIIVSKYEDTVRRQVNRAGHEILLRHILDLKVIQEKYYLKIEVVMKSGNRYEKIITLFQK